MAKSVTRYDEVGNAVIREARPASNVRTAPRDVKAKGAAAVAAWNKANKPQPGKTGEQAMQIVERQIFKRAADMRAKKTIASTARSFTGGQLLEALSANNGPKVPADAPVTQKRAAIASGMAARAANRTEAGGSDGGPKRRAAERFARVARGEKPFGGDSAARANSELAARKDKVRSGTKVSGDVTMAALSGRASGSKAEQAFNEKRSATPKTKGLPPNERAVKLAGTVDARVRAKGSWGNEDVMRRHSRLGRILAAADAVERKRVVDPVKVIETRNETARSLAEQKKATGVDAGRGAAARDLVARNEKDIARAGKPAAGSRSGKAASSSVSRTDILRMANDGIPKGQRVTKVAEATYILKSTFGSVDAAKAEYAKRGMKFQTPRTVSIMGDNKVVKGGPPPSRPVWGEDSYIGKVNAAQAASDAARRNAPKPPATPPGPREHWNKIGSPQPTLKDVVRPGPGQPPGTLTEQQKLALVKSHGMGGAMVASQMPTYPPQGVTNDSAMGMKPPAPPAPPAPSSGSRIPSWGQVNTGLAVVGTGVAAAQAFNKAKQEGKSTGEAMGAGALAATPGALMLGAQPVSNALSKVGDGLLSTAKRAHDAWMPRSPGLGRVLGTNAAEGIIGATGILGVGAKTASAALKVAGKVAAPAMAAWGAYQGAKEDDNAVRGAARGALRSLDPSAIVTGIGAGTGLMKDGRGIGERAYDAVFGGPTQGRVSAAQAQTFAKADANYDHMGQKQPQATGERPGWSPEARIKAYYAQNPTGTNAPYGGDPTNAPGYTPPKDRRPY